MAQTINGLRGNAANAPTERVPRNTSPDPQHVADFASAFETKPAIYIRAHRGFVVTGHLPGDSEDELAVPVSVAGQDADGKDLPNSIAKVTVDREGVNQSPVMLAILAARGYFSVVSQADFAKAAKESAKA